jgi:aryl-alcohol dehydrogenase-like predicted oxidoreductase
MQTRILGKSGIKVSEIGVGCWAIGGADWNLNMEMGWAGTDDKQSLEGLFRAVDLGATHFDTADIYGHGHSERMLGKLIKEVRRDSLIIGTKVGYFTGCAPAAYHPVHMRHQLEMSLANLKTDYIDIYYFHNLHFGESDEYLEGAVEAMHRFKEEGKVRVIGQRGPHRYAPNRLNRVEEMEGKYERFLRIASLIKPSIIQVRYNVLTPAPESLGINIFTWAETNGVGVVINKPLGQGLLLDKYDPNNPPEFGAGDHRRRKSWFKAEGLRVLQRRLLPIKERFGYASEVLVRVALQYCLASSQTACVIAGFKTPSQVEANLAAAGCYLSKADVQFIHDVMSGINEEIGSFFADGSSEVK